MNNASAQLRAVLQRASFAAVLFSAACAAPHTSVRNGPDAGVEHTEAAIQPFWQEIPSAAFRFEMIPVPADPARGIRAFWIGKTEMTWEAFDTFVYRLDEHGAAAAAAGADAVTWPSKPYLPPDRGFGHEGFAAIGMSHKCATEFCRWLSSRTGRHYRLPTEAEWRHACCPDSAASCSPTNSAASLTASAWFAANSGLAPHAVATREPNARGLFDMLGNVAEWCDGAGGLPVTCGGSYRDAAERVSCEARMAPQPGWNASDPQIPKSSWWLVDAPFVGFRVVCESGPGMSGGK